MTICLRLSKAFFSPVYRCADGYEDHAVPKAYILVDDEHLREGRDAQSKLPYNPSSIDSATHRLPSSFSGLYAAPAGPILPWLPAYVSVASKNLWMAREPMEMGMGMGLRPRGTIIMGAFVYLLLCKSILERTRHRWDQYTSTVTLGQPSYSCDCSKILPLSFAQSA